MTVAKILIIVSLIGTQVLGYPPQGRLMPDGAPVPEDAIEHQDSIASASEVGEEYEDGDDSDMYMEPEEAETNPIEKEEEHREAETGPIEMEEEHEESETNPVENEEEEQQEDETNPIENDEEHYEENPQDETNKDTTEVPTEIFEQKNETASDTTEKIESKDQNAENTKQTVQTEATDVEDKSLETDSQNFFPSFAELFTNHRVPFTEQQRYRPNRFLGYFQRDRNGYQTAAATAKDVQHPLLGSGNFGVIRGGTYYPEDKEADEYSTDDTAYNPYYHGANRGRANYYRNPKPQPIRGGDFFANFRDFADITAPPKSSFSHLSVVYANKNGSTTDRITEPRNIIETLRMLEQEEPISAEATTTTEVPRKKQSKGKRKLIKMRQYEDDKARRSRLTVEPLLALS